MHRHVGRQRMAFAPGVHHPVPRDRGGGHVQAHRFATSARERDRERDRLDKMSTKDLMREKEMEEESKEKKKAERRAREKEAAYQERLR